MTPEQEARFNSCIGLVKFIAMNMRPSRSFPLEDLIQAGMIGLLRAAARYRPERSTAAFHTYAYKAIQRHVRSEIIASSPVKLSCHTRLSEAHSVRMISLDVDESDSNGDALAKRRISTGAATAETALLAAEASRLVRRAVDALPEKTRLAVQMRYFTESRPRYREIGKRLGMTGQAAQQRIKGALSVMDTFLAAAWSAPTMRRR